MKERVLGRFWEFWIVLYDQKTKGEEGKARLVDTARWWMALYVLQLKFGSLCSVIERF